MSDEKTVYNETIPYVEKEVEHFVTELRASQSALLARGFLGFDEARLASILEGIKEVLKITPVDRPETHPHPAVQE